VSLVEHRPLDYLDERLDLFVRNLAINRTAVWVYHPGIDPNSFGYKIRFAGLNAEARHYVESFADDGLNGGVLYTVWVYLLVAAIGGILLLRRTATPALIAAGALGVAAVTYQSGLFLGAMGTQYRFEFPVVVIALLVTAIVVAGVRGRRAATPDLR
jgi:hypothetical protein